MMQTTTPTSGAAGDHYAGAVDHYLSPDRHDAVKTLWEEPATRRVLDDVLERLPIREPLRVLDVGCGAADGLALLQSTPMGRRRRLAGLHFDYVGLDLDDKLLETAQRLHQGDTRVSFVHGDIVDGIPDGDHDLVLSCGVPYSHLTQMELGRALTAIFVSAARRARPAAVVVDVLGRYSIEWTSRWARQRWPYRMSFFKTDHEATSTDMTCYSGEELRAVISHAADAAGCQLVALECHDRAIAVGRHTSTGDYTPRLRPYRQLVNALLDPEVDVDCSELVFDVELPAAPTEIEAFFAAFAHSWNELVTRACATQAAVRDRDHLTAVLQPMLASGLERLEATREAGLGVGHSLTAVALTRARS
jgi:SAM-dependent methyltransferase